jgi:hypothetical protein
MHSRELTKQLVIQQVAWQRHRLMPQFISVLLYQLARLHATLSQMLQSVLAFVRIVRPWTQTASLRNNCRDGNFDFGDPPNFQVCVVCPYFQSILMVGDSHLVFGLCQAHIWNKYLKNKLTSQTQQYPSSTWRRRSARVAVNAQFGDSICTRVPSLQHLLYSIRRTLRIGVEE